MSCFVFGIDYKNKWYKLFQVNLLMECITGTTEWKAKRKNCMIEVHFKCQCSNSTLVEKISMHNTSQASKHSHNTSILRLRVITYTCNKRKVLCETLSWYFWDGYHIEFQQKTDCNLPITCMSIQGIS